MMHRLRWKLHMFLLRFRPQERRRIQARIDKYREEMRDLVSRECMGGPMDGKRVKVPRSSRAIDFPWVESLVPVLDSIEEGHLSIGRISYRVGADERLHYVS